MGNVNDHPENYYVDKVKKRCTDCKWTFSMTTTGTDESGYVTKIAIVWPNEVDRFDATGKGKTQRESEHEAAVKASEGTAFY